MRKLNIDLLNDLLLIEPDIFEDYRGKFYESYNKKIFDHLVGRDIHFLQDNCSISSQGTIRGLHFQRNNPQAKLVRVLDGIILDVAVDLRKDSKDFGQVEVVELSSDNNFIFWIPEGFAHGFQVISSSATVAYKVNNYWNSDDEYTLRFDDQDLNIKWDVIPKVLSNKDKQGLSLKEITERGLLL